MNEKDSEQKDLDLSKKDSDKGVESEGTEGNKIVPETEISETDVRNGELSQGSAGRRESSGGKAWMFVAIGLALILVVVLWKPPFGGGSSNEAVATVNGEDITKDEFYTALVAVGGKQTLENIIYEELIKQEADKAGIKVTDADVDKEIAKIEKSLGGSEALATQLKNSGMTIDSLKKQMVPQLSLRKILEKDITITDDEVKQFFEENKAQFDVVEQVKVAHILVATKEEAEAVLKQLKEGADFAKLAAEKSIDPGSKDNGGEYDFFPRGTMHEPFENAAFALKKDELSDVVQTDNGFHVIKLLDRKEAYSATFEEKKEEVRDIIVNNKVYEMSEKWMTDLKAKAEIKNTLTDDEKKDDKADTGKEENAPKE